jgi:hypothetical protein
MTARAAAAIERVRTALAAADKLDPEERDRLAPAERDAVYGVLMTDLRSRRFEAVSPLRLGPPTARIRGPRRSRGGQ